MCLQCGFYKGRQVIDLASQKEKRAARMQAKKEAIKAQFGTEAEAVSQKEVTAEKK